MGLFSKGESVTVSSDSYPDQGRSFVGQSGTVTGAERESVSVRLDGDDQSTGFFAEELKHS